LLSNCSKCSIYNLDKRYICDAQVTPIDETQVSLTILDDYADQLATEVHITFYDDRRGLVSYYCTLSNYKEVIIQEFRNCYAATCQLNEYIGIVQRRNDIKIKTDFKVELSMTDENDQPIMMEVAIKNISAGGFFFVTKEELPVGKVFSFIFKKGSLPLILQGSILREQETATGLHGYGCKFILLSTAKEAIIREYVFRQQLQQKNF
jgi:c-di-GMP-binding flagellar brake protein YcgR